MLRLHGFAISNYFNMVKLALLEKGIPFEVVHTRGGQDPAFLAVSPRGKVPCLETPQGFISETNVILEYIEETQGGKPLLPSDPYQRAEVRALTKEIELYIELAARSCYPEAFFGVQLDQAIKDKAREELFNGVAALRRHGRFAPYVAGSELTIADLMFLYSIDLAQMVARKLFDTDLLADWPQARALLELLNQNPHVQQITADKQAEMQAYMATKG